jgi:hypothetical protein
MSRIEYGIVASMIVLVSAGCKADGPRVEAIPIELPPAEAVLSQEFTRVLSARELPSGQVLVTDPRENRIYFADFDADSVRLLGAVGDGPGEYREAGRLYAISEDSTIMTDRRARRWLTFIGSDVGEIVAPDHPAVEASSRGSVLGMDSQGFLIARIAAPGSSGMADSLLIVRINRTTGATELIGKSPSSSESGVSMGSAAASGGGVPERPTYVMSIITYDQAAVFPDGWIGIARSNPYRIDWCDPESPCRVADAEIEQALPYAVEDKIEYLRLAEATASWPPTQDPEETVGWPEFIPPFTLPASVTDGTSVYPSPDGRIVVRRIPSANAPANRYDVIGRSGQLEGWLHLPSNHEIVEFGARYLYVSVTDALGVQRLQRHPLPWLSL